MRLQVNDGVGGAFDYHCDSSPGLDTREISALFYLNESWVEAHGGELRLLPFPDAPRAFPPVAGRVVLFNAHCMLHGTAPTPVPRYCFTLWLYERKDRPPDAKRATASALRTGCAKLRFADHVAACLADRHAAGSAARARALAEHEEGLARIRSLAAKVPILAQAADVATPVADRWQWW